MSSEFFKLYRLCEARNKMVEHEKMKGKEKRKTHDNEPKKKSALLPSTKVSYGQINKSTDKKIEFNIKSKLGPVRSMDPTAKYSKSKNKKPYLMNLKLKRLQT